MPTVEKRMSSFLNTATQSVAHLMNSVKKQINPDPVSLLGNVRWLMDQLNVTRLPEEHFFEKYLVVGVPEVS